MREETTMTKLLTVVATVSLIAALAACSKDDAGTSKAPASGAEHAAKASDEHAPADVVPGSHEDWCGEHAVPESQCTRCNAELIAAFKATGDWCEEHGLPESQCLECNPELKIVRPPPAGGDNTAE
jgi:hypothetical protein